MKIFDLSGKTILVTGANGWLASGFIEPCLSFGARIIMVDSSPAVKDTAVKLSKKYPRKVDTVIVDMFDQKAYQQALNKIAKTHQMYGIINNAFCFGKSNVETGAEGDFMSLSDEQWMTAFESGILWAVQTVKPFLPAMRKNKGGSIINICSMYALIAPNPNLYSGEFKKYLSQPTYTSAKHGLWGWTKYMASFLAKDQVRCNAIAPGAFSKPATDAKFIKRLKDIIPLQTIGKPADLAGAVIYLLSESSSYMTGQCLTIDGGWTVR
ncbi:MAG: SDR family oxidoreductase [Candidatus Omnitrophica bacterium]|nr:SDR family oxidoreductase [Candidatus Omnitrophota bacterium]